MQGWFRLGRFIFGKILSFRNLLPETHCTNRTSTTSELDFLIHCWFEYPVFSSATCLLLTWKTQASKVASQPSSAATRQQTPKMQSLLIIPCQLSPPKQFQLWQNKSYLQTPKRLENCDKELPRLCVRSSSSQTSKRCKAAKKIFKFKSLQSWATNTLEPSAAK